MFNTLRVVVLGAVFVPSLALAQSGLVQSGVGDDRVSLPDGPGSLGGLGDNAQVSGNQGQMTYEVPFEVADGFPMASPSFGLSYNSGSGTGVAGMGWNVDMPAVERMSSRGLPRYTADDFITAGDELVRIPGTTPPVYRARFEGGFVRYTWVDAGAEGYWKAELPNGVVQYYGADSAGTLVPTSRVGDAAGTFRWHLVESVDPFGHKVTWRYTKPGTGGYALVDEVGWHHDGSNVPRATISFTYEVREDLVSDCKPGFNLVLGHRLKTARSRSAGQLLMRYELTYEDYAQSGGGSRLRGVEGFAADNTPSPVKPTFAYTRALGGTCSTDACGRPYTRSMGSIGVSLQARTATLVDLDGDSLPDLLETPTTGVHRVRLAVLGADGTHTFSPAVDSAVMPSSSFKLNDGSVQLLDLDGDGATDMVNARTGSILINGGTGDWLMAGELGMTAVGALPNFDVDAMDGERSIRFLDYDNDKRIDVIQATQAGTTIYRNTGNDFVQDMGVMAIGKGFQEDRLQLADMNGDGLLDAVTVAAGVIAYRLNLGHGRWAPQVDITGLPIMDGELDLVDLEDINGDGIADLLVVSGNQVRYAVNKNGASFLDAETLTATQVPGIPERLSTTTVLTADMNGNGSTDIVWITDNGAVTYLELFPVRPNLVSRIENGLGMVTTVQYRSAAEMMAAAGGAGSWAYRLPHSTLVVSRTEMTELVANVIQDTTYVYRDGYYDGTDKQFRGFGTVTATSDADATQESSRTVTTYDLGVTDRYRAGKVLTAETWSGMRAINATTNTWADCPVAGVPMDLQPFPVRHVCMTASETVTKEGTPEAEWVTTRRTMEYDGYGNVTLSTNHGVVAVGGQGCAACDASAGNEDRGTPCGMMCTGDERYEEATFAVPTAMGRWITGLAVTQRGYAVAGGRTTETTTYYDGAAFTGLPAGQFDKGLPSRVTSRVSETANDVIEAERTEYNADGYPVTVLDPLGSPTGQDHKRTYVYSDDGLDLVQVDLHLVDSVGAPYQLRRTFTYEPAWGSMASATTWRLVRNGAAQGATGETFFTYDTLNRLVAVVRPGGDNAQNPTETLAYNYGSPVSSIVRTRRVAAGMADVETRVTCMDGFGRTLQERVLVAPGSWLVTGFTLHNTQGEAVAIYKNHVSSNMACDMTPPTDIPAHRFRRDGTGRLTEVIHPDAAEWGGTANGTRTTYLPLKERHEDEADGISGHRNAGTPITVFRNGLGAPYRHERLASSSAAPQVLRFHYDGLGMVAGVTDPAGNRKTQQRDLLGRITRLDDPDTGVTTFQYDAAGNTVRVTDARGVSIVNTFDGLNRLVTRQQDGMADTLAAYAYDVAPTGCAASDCTNLAGQLASVNFPLGDGTRATDWYGYDVRQLHRHTTRAMHGTTFTFNTERDNLSRVTRKTYPGSRELRYTRDMAGRLTGIPGHVTSVAYAEDGQLQSLELANGITRTNTRDLRDRVTSVSHRRANGNVVAEQDYTWDRHEALLEVQDGRPEDNLPHGNVRYTQDGLGRVTRIEYDSARAAHAETLDLAYDALDNMTSRVSSLGAASPAHLAALAYGANGAGPRAVTSADGVTYAYDAAGNMVTRGSQTLVVDHLGRLSRVEEAGNTVVQFGYGPETGLLVRREGARTTLFPAEDYEVRDGVSSVLVNVGDITVASVDKVDLQTALYRDVAPATVSGSAVTPAPDGTISAADAWIAHAAGSILPALSGDASDSNALLAASARRMVTGTGELATYMHHDRTGSVLATTDAQGNVVERSEFYAWGQERLAGDGLRERHRFTGKEKDASGLIHHGVRALDPRLGRWVSADPTFTRWDAETVDNADSVDEAVQVYAYVRNRLGQSFDATGREADDDDPMDGAADSDAGGDGDAEASSSAGDARSDTPQTNRASNASASSSSNASSAARSGNAGAPDADGGGDSDASPAGSPPSAAGGQAKRINKADLPRMTPKAARVFRAVINTAIVAVAGLVLPPVQAVKAAANAKPFQNRGKVFTASLKKSYFGKGTKMDNGYRGMVAGVARMSWKDGVKAGEIFGKKNRATGAYRKRGENMKRAREAKNQYKAQKAADKAAAKNK